MLHPQILKLDVAGTPVRWIRWEEAAVEYARQRVKWEAGTERIVVFGGIGREGVRSSLSMSTIIAVSDRARGTRRNVRLTNDTLFRRDRNTCAYCGATCPRHKLTRDHVVPTSRGGPNIWTNVVAACLGCNNRKSDLTPEEAGMPLLYAPFRPSPVEAMLLLGRHVLADQMTYLKAHLPRGSRLS